MFGSFDEEISGVLCRTKDSAVIGVNAAHAVTRQRFTAAHELGHLLLHRGRAVIVEEDFRVNFRREDSKVTSKQEEVEANSFAASLLIPEESVLEAVRQMVDEDDDDSSAWSTADVAWLARKFKVSPQAMGIRLANLGIRHPGY